MTRVTVTAFTAARMLEIEQNAVVSGRIVDDNLILETKGGTNITAGSVRGRPGPKGDPGGIWDATDELTGAVKLAGNIGGTALEPKVTGELDNTVDLSDARVKGVLVDPETDEETPIETSAKDVLERVAAVEPLAASKVTASGATTVLWSGTQAEYLTVPTNVRNAPGFIAVIKS